MRDLQQESQARTHGTYAIFFWWNLCDDWSNLGVAPAKHRLDGISASSPRIMSTKRVIPFPHGFVSSFYVPTIDSTTVTILSGWRCPWPAPDRSLTHFLPSRDALAHTANARPSAYVLLEAFGDSIGYSRVNCRL